MTSYGMNEIHPSALLADSVKVYQFATICEKAWLGQGVVVGSAAWIGKGVVVGHSTRIQHGAFIPNNTVIGVHVFIGPNVTLTDDKYPQAGNTEYTPQPPILEDACSLGAGCVVLPGVRIGHGALVGAGAVVTQDVPPFTTVYGCPARAVPHDAQKEP